ncbi:helix-turn-helix domain-containing protein [Halostreptopolyspora alba]|uniref:XRE family transcriptional regulator n=1 Tax=Halostreptopolyspora alba TaxID=2487137 RepID=A0A3N0E781_9ACTN|nr:XRE family transcriptional regulator [Nocardiopsaceae bacterium YIM 96095]
MGTAKPTVERRQLGLTLRRLRERAGLSQAAAGKAIGRTAARMSQVENGIGVLNPDDLLAFLDHVGVKGEERSTVLSLGTQARRRSRRALYTDSLPGSFQRLADLEADATRIHSYESGIIPGLLQSPDYMRAVIRSCDGVWWEASEQEVKSRIGFRLEQQHRVMEADVPKRLSFVFTEDALHHEIGGPSVMRGQVLHMLQLVESESALSIQVMPSGIRDNPLLGGGILVLEFENAPRIGFATSLYGPAVYHDSEADTTAFMKGFECASKLALSPDDSRDVLLRRLKEN